MDPGGVAFCNNSALIHPGSATHPLQELLPDGPTIFTVEINFHGCGRDAENSFGGLVELSTSVAHLSLSVLLYSLETSASLYFDSFSSL